MATRRSAEATPKKTVSVKLKRQISEIVVEAPSVTLTIELDDDLYIDDVGVSSAIDHPLEHVENDFYACLFDMQDENFKEFLQVLNKAREGQKLAQKGADNYDTVNVKGVDLEAITEEML